MFVAIGVNNTGHKEVIGFDVYDSEKTSTWKAFFESLKSRGLRGVDIVIFDAHSGLREAMSILEEGFEDSITIMALPSKYRMALRTSNIIERENREIRRREKVIQIFPNTDSIIRLIGALLMDDHNDWSTRQRLFDMKEYFDNRGIIQSKLQRSNVA